MMVNTLSAQFVIPTIGYGIEAGGVRGDNQGDKEDWVPRVRGHVQIKLSNIFLTQVGVSYFKLKAGDIYDTQTMMGDVRFLVGPFQMSQMFPFMYVGFGATKDMSDRSTKYLPVIPFGLGVQTRLGEQLTLQVNAGYNLVVSDKLDGIQRIDSDQNRFTNKKHDGYFDFMIGLVYGSHSKSAKEKKSPPADKGQTINPNRIDTDNDGLTDMDETQKYKTDPVKQDTDMDGLLDGEEVFKYRTDPLKVDTDADLLNDGEEVTKYRTDPTKSDTDGDGLFDGDEVAKYRTDPLKTDSDMDMLTDGDEVVKYRTDPMKTDSDADLLLDGEEVMKYKTDPNKADTDGDGISDYTEVTMYHSSPTKIDTDDGGMNDGAEIKAGKNPLDSKDDLFDLTKGKKVILRGINFESGKAIILPESEPILEKVRASLEQNAEVTVIITGFTDSVGKDETNRTLSLKRAQAVKDWLVARNIKSSRMKVVGKGESELIASNDTADGRAQNRRIEFVVE